MKTISDIKNLLIEDFIEKKRNKIKMYNQTQKERKREKKRQMIEEIKKQRQENSVLFDNF
jgi:hypothetical protein